MQRTHLMRLAAILALLGAAVWFFSGRYAQKADTGSAGAVAADFSFPDLLGKQVHLSDFKGKIVLLDFWATWCGPCVEEVPELKGIYEKFREKGFTVVGISMDEEGAPVVEPFVRENKIPYPILLSKGDPGPEYQIRGLPSAYLVDRQGRIIQEYFGFKDGNDVERDISAALASKS